MIKSTFSLKKRSFTVRYMFSFSAVMSVALLLGAAIITSTEVSYIRLETTDSLVEEGKQFSIDVYAYATEPVNAVDITLQFNSKSVEVTGVDTGQSVLTIWTQDPVIEDSSVRLQGGTYRKGFLGDHMIATINMKAKKTGQSDFQVTDIVLLAGDGEGTPVMVADSLDSTVSLYIYNESSDSHNISVDVEVDVVSDLDGDGKVSLRDISIFMSAWHNKSKIYDFNKDGKMSFRDFSIILANYFF